MSYRPTTGVWYERLSTIVEINYVLQTWCLAEIRGLSTIVEINYVLQTTIQVLSLPKSTIVEINYVLQTCLITKQPTTSTIVEINYVLQTSRAAQPRLQDLQQQKLIMSYRPFAEIAGTTEIYNSRN